MKTPKPKTCKECGEQFTPFQTTQKVCGYKCAALLARKTGAKQRTKAAKDAHTAHKKQFYTNDRPTQLKLAQAAFNAYIRWRDRDEPCISCGRFHQGQYHAGHYRSVGAAPHLRFNQFNNNKQCAPCNNHKSGNAIEYRINLVKKYGVEKVEEIESNNAPAKLTIDNIHCIIRYYRKLLKHAKEEV